MSFFGIGSDVGATEPIFQAWKGSITNLFAGQSSGQSNTGYGNTGFGAQAAAGNTSGHENTAVGSQALFANETGNDNVAVGVGALGDTLGGTNTAIGAYALGAQRNGSGNVAIGYYAGYTEPNTSNSFFVGNVSQGSTYNDQHYSLMYGQFAGVAGSLTGQQLTVNGTLNVNGNLYTAGTFFSNASTTLFQSSASSIDAVWQFKSGGALPGDSNFKQKNYIEMLMPYASGSSNVLRIGYGPWDNIQPAIYSSDWLSFWTGGQYRMNWSISGPLYFANGANICGDESITIGDAASFTRFSIGYFKTSVNIGTNSRETGTLYLGYGGASLSGDTTGNLTLTGPQLKVNGNLTVSSVYIGTSLNLGASNTASGAASIVSGNSNTASGQYSAVIGGQGNTASGINSFVTGYQSVANGSCAIAMGYNASATVDYGVALQGSTTNGIAIGSRSHSNTNGVAIGINANASNYGYTDAIAIGTNSTSDQYCTAVGNGSTAEWNSVAYGLNAFGWNQGVAIGNFSTNGYSSYGVAVGYESNSATSGGTGGIAIGFNAQADSYSTSLGCSSFSTDIATAVGVNTIANHISVSIGVGCNSVYSSVAIGRDCVANVTGQAIAIGERAYAGAYDSVAIGSEDYPNTNIAQVPNGWAHTAEICGGTATLNGGLNFRGHGIADGSGNLYANGIVQIGSGALPAGANGQIAYDGTHFYGYTGGAWKQLDN